MTNKRQSRLRRSRRGRAKILEMKSVRLCVNRTNLHVYAQIIDRCGGRVLAAASTLESDVRKELKNGGNVAAAVVVGRLIAERARSVGVEVVSFDRSGFRYHGRVKALADAARGAGLRF